MEKTPRQGSSKDRGLDISRVTPSADPGDPKYQQSNLGHLEKGAAEADLATMCPCSHSSIQHGQGVHGSSSGYAACLMKGCNCTGFGQRPGMGMSWAYEGPR